MYGMNLNYDNFQFCDDDRDLNGSRWERGNTSTEWTFKSLYKGNRIPVAFEPKEGKTYYAVIAIWNTGDSFGDDINHSHEVMDVYENSNDAYAAMNDIMACEKQVKLKFKNHQGETVMVSNPWKGYFESLGSVRVYSLTYHDKKVG